jgi:hypothetical protein
MRRGGLGIAAIILNNCDPRYSHWLYRVFGGGLEVDSLGRVYFAGIDTPVISRYDQNGELEQKLGWIPDDFRKAPSDFQNRNGDPMELID